jgi:hypothetical protein
MRMRTTEVRELGFGTKRPGARPELIGSDTKLSCGLVGRDMIQAMILSNTRISRTTRVRAAATVLTVGTTAMLAVPGCSGGTASPSGTSAAGSPAPPASKVTSDPLQECSVIADDDTEIELSGPGALQACQDAAAGRWPSYLRRSGQWQASNQPAGDYVLVGATFASRAFI